MIEKTPYIIVDNRKIAPIRRASGTLPVPAERSNQDLPFGVVDRVTISNAAVEKYRQLQITGDADPALHPPHSQNSQPTIVYLLTDASQKYR